MSYRDDLAYKIETYTGEQLLMLLYDALGENLDTVKEYIQTGKLDQADVTLDHSREILAYLDATLGEEQDHVSFTTKQLYIYINTLITQSRITGNIQYLEEAKKIILPLRDGWKNLAEKQEKHQLGSKKNVYTGMTYGKKDIHIYSDSKEWEEG